MSREQFMAEHERAGEERDTGVFSAIHLIERARKAIPAALKSCTRWTWNPVAAQAVLHHLRDLRNEVYDILHIRPKPHDENVYLQLQLVDELLRIAETKLLTLLDEGLE